MIIFASACDANYAAMNLALHHSLLAHATDDQWVHWWVTLDDETAALANAARERLVAHGHRDVLRVVPGDAVLTATPGLRHALNNRTGGAYYWTWASQVTAFVAGSAAPSDWVVYLDSDNWCLGDPMPSLREVPDDADVAMLTHRFPPHRASMKNRAHWWVGFNAFRATPRGQAAAAWWAAMVRARCALHDDGDAYLDIPSGLAGDQPPLHALHRIAKVHEIQRPGFVASWNADDSTLDLGAAWLFQAHEFKFSRDGTVVKRTGYPMPPAFLERVAAPYEAAVLAAAKELHA
ncbi:MAG: hypothetical protein Q8O71_01650 [bacterium]|nr:hypothetical protein [bacterium]